MDNFFDDIEAILEQDSAPYNESELFDEYDCFDFLYDD